MTTSERDNENLQSLKNGKKEYLLVILSELFACCSFTTQSDLVGFQEGK